MSGNAQPLLPGLPVLCVGADPAVDAAADLLGLLGADIARAGERGLVAPGLAAGLAESGFLGAIDSTGALGEPPFPVVRVEPVDDRWADAGGPAITGGPGGSWTDGGVLAAEAAGAGLVVQLLAALGGAAVAVDGARALTDRAAMTRFEPEVGTSLGRSAVFEKAADGWVVLNLARPDDVAAIPALVGERVDPADWPAIRAALSARSVERIGAQAQVLGLPVAVVRHPPGDPQLVARGQQPVRAPWLIDGAVPRRPRMRSGPPPGIAPAATRTPVVVELASLWAGPLAGSLLAKSGFRVIKVETTDRPDGARRGSPAVFDHLHAGKEMVAIDRRDEADRRLLDRLLVAADVVIESSRPRVMAQWGVAVDALVAAGTNWLAITGYGRTGPWADRVAFGDDAAVAAGVVAPSEPPDFIGDAIADPLAGLYTAAAALACIAGRDRASSPGPGRLIDVALREAAAYAARRSTWRPSDPGPAPTGPASAATAGALGIDTVGVRAEFGE